MIKETTKNREATEQILIDAVGRIIEDKGFEALGINAVAAEAGVSKMLIYRYFESLEGLISAYIRQKDYWINFQIPLPQKQQLGAFLKQMFHQQMDMLEQDYVLRRLYRWELTTQNQFVENLRQQRENKGMMLIQAVSQLTHHPKEQVAAMATILTAAISYLALAGENCNTFNGLPLHREQGKKAIIEAIDLLIELWIKSDTND